MKKVVAVLVVLLIALLCFMEIKTDIISTAAGETYEAAIDYLEEVIGQNLSLEDTGEVTGNKLLHSWNDSILHIMENNLVVQAAAQTGELPARYDYRETGRQSVIKDQLYEGTCWAMAATTALETTIRPENQAVFSSDHLTFYNPHEVDLVNGGNYYMSMAYLLGWYGPVSEADDPSGDDYSPEGLSPIYHVQQVNILDSFDYDGRLINGNEEERAQAVTGMARMREDIKKLVLNCGGVEASMYFDLNIQYGYSDYYNNSTNAYCYTGDEAANHEVVIIGWDDNFPASGFSQPVEGDGAFICQNSWGSMFGEDGVFYVSYYDSNLMTVCVCYCEVQGTDNYNNIYQYDELGWSGQLGYGDELGYYANVYTARGNESLEAVGFYTLGPNSDFTVYFVPEFTDESSLRIMEPAAYGHLDNMGYYTIPVNSECLLEEGKNYAVIVKIVTPNSTSPIAVEYAGYGSRDELECNGLGYISHDGVTWTVAETDNQSDLCLKVYTNNR